MNINSSRLQGDSSLRPGFPIAIRRYAEAVGSVVLATFVCLIVLGNWKDVTLLSLVDQFSNVFKHVDFNNGFFTKIASLEVAWIFAGCFVLSFVFRAFFFAACHLLSRKKFGDLYIGLRDVAVVVIVVVALVQLTSMIGIFQQERQPDTKIKNLHYQRISARVENVVERFKKHIPQGATLKLVTDMPYKKRDPAMYIHRALVFHFYPTDLRNMRQKEVSHFLFYDKRNFTKSVPDGFEVVGRLNRRMAVAARKGSSAQ